MITIIAATNAQKILHYLIDKPGERILASDIQESTGLSKSGVNKALRELIESQFIYREKKGNMFFYYVLLNPVIKHMKMLKTLLLIDPLIEKVKALSSTIYLFGSTARGEDNSESDIDLFVVTQQGNEVKQVFDKNKVARNIQLIIKSSVEFSGLKQKDKIFYHEVISGLRLWEG